MEKQEGGEAGNSHVGSGMCLAYLTMVIPPAHRQLQLQRDPLGIGLSRPGLGYDARKERIIERKLQIPKEHEKPGPPIRSLEVRPGPSQEPSRADIAALQGIPEAALAFPGRAL